MDDATDHCDYFYPDHGHGTTNGAGFGWRGSSGSVSVVCVLGFVACSEFILNHPLVEVVVE